MIEILESKDTLSEFIRDYEGIVLSVCDEEVIIFFDLAHIHYTVISDKTIKTYSLSDEIETFLEFFKEEFRNYPLEDLIIIKYINSTEDYKITVF